MVYRKYVFAGILVGMVCFAGCGTPRPNYMSTSFDPQQVDRIVILPFLDNRVKPNPEHDFDFMCNHSLDMIVNMIKSKGYLVLQSGDVGTVSSYSIQDLPKKAVDSKDADSVDPDSVDAVWVKNLGPSSDRWVLVPMFDDLSTQFLVIGFSADAKISAYLFDKQLCELSWKNTGEGSMSVGILSAPIFNAVAGRQGLQKEAVSSASLTCADAFPKRKRVSGK